MIYTLTLNPAIDLFIDTNEMNPNTVNRTNSYDIQANGKGVNVSFILKKLGVNSKALGIGGGFTSKFIEETLTNYGIENDFINVPEPTRINVFTHVNSTNQEFKLVNPGPTVPIARQEELLKKIQGIVIENDYLVISGSFAKGIDPAIIEKIAKIIEQNNAHLIVDTSYSNVLDILKYKPLLIKPNEVELATWFKHSPDESAEELIKDAKKLIDLGAENVLLSLGADGAILINKNHTLKGNAPKISVLNTAGSGDTMLGTFIGGMVKGMTNEDNLIKSIAAGSDTASKSWLTEFEDDRMNELVNQIKIEKMEV